MEKMTREQVIAQEIRDMQEWDKKLLQELCDIAGLGKEFEESDGETFEKVAFEAASILKVELT